MAKKRKNSLVRFLIKDLNQEVFMVQPQGNFQVNEEKYWQFTIQAPYGMPVFIEELLSAMFFEYGCSGVATSDPQLIAMHLSEGSWDASIFDEGWDKNAQKLVIRGWFAYDGDNPSQTENIVAFREALASLSVFYSDWGLTLSEAPAPGVDWQKEWKKFFHTMKIGKRTVIRPVWEEYLPQPGEIVIDIDPGMAFGTGDHATTAMCLRALERYLQEDAKVADIGTGSAILAIAAALMGAKSVDAVENDERSLAFAAENVALNNLSDRITLSEGDLGSGLEGGYDLIVANIVTDVILRFLPQAAQLLKPGGILVMSGIIDTRGQEVEEALPLAGFALIDKEKEENWLALTGRMEMAL